MSPTCPRLLLLVPLADHDRHAALVEYIITDGAEDCLLELALSAGSHDDHADPLLPGRADNTLPCLGASPRDPAVGDLEHKREEEGSRVFRIAVITQRLDLY